MYFAIDSFEIFRHVLLNSVYEACEFFKVLFLMFGVRCFQGQGSVQDWKLCVQTQCKDLVFGPGSGLWLV